MADGGVSLAPGGGGDGRGGQARRGQLFRKYVVLFVGLVSGALLTSGLVQSYFSYQENQRALVRLQREKAIVAATRIEQFIREIERQLAGAVQGPLVGGSASPEQRRNDYLRLLRQVPAITELSYLNSEGREQDRVSRLAMNVPKSDLDFSQDPRFLEAKANKLYHSPVYFRNESEPYMTIALLESGTSPGVTAAEVNLKLIWDVVSRIQVGQAGRAYVVDSDGRLIAHPDISLVLQKTDFSSRPQVQLALQGQPQVGDDRMTAIGTDAQGRTVLDAWETVDPPGWSVFVEQPLEEAFAPLYASLVRTAILLLVGLLLAVLASLVLARRMVTPIQALQQSAARIGAGALDQRIEVRSGDELESLAEEFNRMTAQLRESYANLEQKVEERTRDLTESLEQQTATAEILRVISGSPTDVEPVLLAVSQSAARLFDAEVTILRLEQDALRLAAAYSPYPGRTNPTGLEFPLGRASVAGRAVVERRVIHVDDLSADPINEFPDGASVARALGARTVLAAPLLREGSAVGAIVVVRRGEIRPFSQKQIELLETFANQAVIAVENVSLFREIQEKSRQLEIASQHKSEFLANMSHELRTPLNAVIGFSEVLLERMFGDLNEKQEEYLQDILSSGKHLLSLINDILDLSKVEAGRMELDLGEFSLREALDNGLTMVKERASRHGIQLSLQVDPGLELIEADERKVKQVVFNLLSNAVKFTPDGGRIEVVARTIEDEVWVSVRDSGIGIAPEDCERIFEEFRQAGHAVVKAQEGTGLGLSLARKFVELHGGRIWVESEVGLGSTFTFSLPPRRAHDDLAVSDPSSASVNGRDANARSDGATVTGTVGQP